MTFPYNWYFQSWNKATCLGFFPIMSLFHIISLQLVLRYNFPLAVTSLEIVLPPVARSASRPSCFRSIATRASSSSLFRSRNCTLAWENPPMMGCWWWLTNNHGQQWWDVKYYIYFLKGCVCALVITSTSYSICILILLYSFHTIIYVIIYVFSLKPEQLSPVWSAATSKYLEFNVSKSEALWKCFKC